MLFVLKNLGKLKDRPKWFRDEIYECIFRAISAFTEEKRIEYETEMNDEKRLNGMMRAKLEEGIEQGLEKGLQKGRSDMILKMYSKGMTLNDISSLLDISESELKSIIDTIDSK